jgi:tetratricopeptide (TPR) repeat protein
MRGKAYNWESHMNGLRSLVARIFGRESQTDPPARPDDMSLSPGPGSVPHEAISCVDEGQQLAALGQWEEAIACYDRSLTLDPQNADVWCSKGLCHAALGRLEEAVACYDQAVAMDRHLAAAWFSKALVEEQIGRTRDAAGSYEGFIAVASSSDTAQIKHARQRLRELGYGDDSAADPPAPPEPILSAPNPRPPLRGTTVGVAGYDEGDHIGEFEVQGVLGRGGFGVVYLVRLAIYGDIASLRTFRAENLASRGRPSDHYVTYALKTLRDEYLVDPSVRQRFRHEAQMLVDLERHPHLLQADFVDEIAGRLYIATEYIAPNAEGLNSLEGYLERRPPDLAQSLRWAIQCCYGIEYAYSRGLRCHRDLKPANILITQEGTVKIADFGLAGALDQARLADGIQTPTEDGRLGFSGQTLEGAGFGTPTHMPPEQFATAAACDERSDVYAFGVVLYQMATGGQVPFLAAPLRDRSLEERRRFWTEMRQLHATAAVPQLDSALFPIIQRCLAKEPGERYVNFRELRAALELLLRRVTGEVVHPPSISQLTNGEWHLKGYCFSVLKRWEEAIACYDQSLALDSQRAAAWTNKGICLSSLGRREEAIACIERALALNPFWAGAWDNKGSVLIDLGRLQEALSCFERALALDPHSASAWNNKGVSLDKLGRVAEAVACSDRALNLAPQEAVFWKNKGGFLAGLDHREEAIACIDRALTLNPRLAAAWSSKGENLAHLGRHVEALACCDRALDIDPQLVVAWGNKGANLAALGRRGEAISCYDRALAIDPKNAMAWNNKGNNLAVLGRMGEAMACYEKALALDPQYANAWFNKATAEEQTGQVGDAASSYEHFLALAPPAEVARIQVARWRLHELRGR